MNEIYSHKQSHFVGLPAPAIAVQWESHHIPPFPLSRVCIRSITPKADLQPRLLLNRGKCSYSVVDALESIMN